jgi:hypothetical protein
MCWVLHKLAAPANWPFLFVQPARCSSASPFHSPTAHLLVPAALPRTGGLPQTWEHSNRTDNTTGFVGDHDPVDVLDIGAARAPIGGVYRVKVRRGPLGEGIMNPVCGCGGR